MGITIINAFPRFSSNLPLLFYVYAFRRAIHAVNEERAALFHRSGLLFPRNLVVHAGNFIGRFTSPAPSFCIVIQTSELSGTEVCVYIRVLGEGDRVQNVSTFINKIVSILSVLNFKFSALKKHHVVHVTLYYSYF